MKIRKILSMIMCAVVLSFVPFMFSACKEKTYRLTAYVSSTFGEKGEGGTITPEGVTTLEQGKNQKFVISAANGFEIANIIVNGVELEKNTYNTNYYEYTVQNIQMDTTIEVVFDYKLVNIKFVLVENDTETWVDLTGAPTQATVPQPMLQPITFPVVAGKTIEWRLGDKTNGQILTAESVLNSSASIITIYGIVK